MNKNKTLKVSGRILVAVGIYCTLNWIYKLVVGQDAFIMLSDELGPFFLIVGIFYLYRYKKLEKIQPK